MDPNSNPETEGRLDRKAPSECPKAHPRLSGGDYDDPITRAFLNGVLDSATCISLIATDEIGRITLFNAGAENLLGYAAGEMVGGRSLASIHLPGEIAAVAAETASSEGPPLEGFAALAHYAAENRGRPREWTYVRKDGTRFPVRLSITPLRLAGGTLCGYLAVAMDISDRKAWERELARSERKFRALVANLPNTVYRGYPDGTIDFVGENVEALTGYTKEELLSGKVKLYDLLVDEGGARRRPPPLPPLKNGGAYISEYRLRTKGGDVVWVEERGHIIRNREGEIEFITGSLLDISRRKMAEQALNDSEEKYRSLFVSGPNPLFVVDRRTGEIFDANPMAEEVYGYRPRELAGRPCAILCTAPGEEREGRCGNDLRADECAEFSRLRHYKKGGEPFLVKVKACPITYAGRKAFILAVTDITDMVRMDAQLLQANKMASLGEMSAGMAHELNQPLNAIKIGNEYLKMMIQQGREVPEWDLLQVVSEVSHQVDRASEIIQRLRAFGRKPDFVAETEPVDLNRAIRAVLDILGHQIALHNIDVDLRLADGLPRVQAHNNLLEQVFFNLITNARDAIEMKPEPDDPRGIIGTITIRTYPAGGRVAATVTDTGIGITEEAMEKIFDPFFTTKEVGKGMGMGLSIIYGIIRDFDGDIQVEGRPGEGARFTVSFTALPADQNGDPHGEDTDHRR